MVFFFFFFFRFTFFFFRFTSSLFLSRPWSSYFPFLQRLHITLSRRARFNHLRLPHFFFIVNRSSRLIIVFLKFVILTTHLLSALLLLSNVILFIIFCYKSYLLPYSTPHSILSYKNYEVFSAIFKFLSYVSFIIAI